VDYIQKLTGKRTSELVEMSQAREAWHELVVTSLTQLEGAIVITVLCIINVFVTVIVITVVVTRMTWTKA